MSGFWYLASPYTRYHAGINSAHVRACSVTARLVAEGIPVFSPIAHFHPIALYGGLDPKDGKLWAEADAPFILAAKGIIVCRLKGWDASTGVRAEIAAFAKAEKPIVYISPDGGIPDELRA